MEYLSFYIKIYIFFKYKNKRLTYKDSMSFDLHISSTSSWVKPLLIVLIKIKIYVLFNKYT